MKKNMCGTLQCLGALVCVISNNLKSIVTYRKIVLWCRKYNMYSILSFLIKIERLLRFRLSEKMLDDWYMNVGRKNSDVRAEMRIYQPVPNWNKLSINDKRQIYSSVMYY